MNYGALEIDGQMCYVGRIHPHAVAFLFNLRKADCRKNLNGICEQLKAEAIGFV